MLGNVVSEFFSCEFVITALQNLVIILLWMNSYISDFVIFFFALGY